MFIKNRKGMEALQMVILGLLIVALGVLFISKFSEGVKSGGDAANGAAASAGNGMDNNVIATITAP